MSEEHPWLAELAAYLVGALDQGETELMREHLAECPICQAEYAELSPAVEALGRVPAEAFESAGAVRAVPPRAATGETSAAPLAADAPDPEMWERLRARAGLAQPDPAGSTVAAAGRLEGDRGRKRVRPRPRPGGPRSRRPMRPGLAAAVSGVLVAAATAGVFIGFKLGPSNSANTQSTSAAPYSVVTGTNPADGVTASISYRPMEWGSWVQATLKGVPPGTDCIMYALDAHGDKAVASTWWAPSTPGLAATVPGGVAMQANAITSFQVTTSSGTVLLSVPA